MHRIKRYYGGMGGGVNLLGGRVGGVNYYVLIGREGGGIMRLSYSEYIIFIVRIYNIHIMYLCC